MSQEEPTPTLRLRVATLRRVAWFDPQLAGELAPAGTLLGRMPADAEMEYAIPRGEVANLARYRRPGESDEAMMRRYCDAHAIPHGHD